MAPDIHRIFELATDTNGQKILHVPGSEYFGQVPEKKFLEICEQFTIAKSSCGQLIWEKFEDYAKLALKEENRNLSGDILWNKVDATTDDPLYQVQDFVDMGFPMSRTGLAIYDLTKERESFSPTNEDYMVIVPTNHGEKISRQDKVETVLKYSQQKL